MIVRLFNRRSTDRADPPANAAAPPSDPAPAAEPDIRAAPPAPAAVLLPPPAFKIQRATAGADDALSRPTQARSPFTPTHPVQTASALIGRRPQVDRAIAAIELERAHVAIFGERGHGKTSLANIVATLATDAGFGVVRHACSAGATFSELFGALLEKIPQRFLRHAAGEQEQPAPLPDSWTVASATAALERVRSGHVLLFVDEFDRLAAANARRDVAELLKNVSDAALPVSFVLIGVAESLGELLALHQSIHRNLVAIPMPLLPDAHLSTLLNQGCETLGLKLEWNAEKMLLQLAHQSPYTAQQLGLHATAMTQARGADTVTAADVAAAARLVLEETRPVFAPLLDPLPLDRRAPEGPTWAELLYEAARAPCDGFGWFAARDVAIANCEDDLSSLARPDSGPILRVRRHAGRLEFVFARANLRNHLLLRAAERSGAI